MKKSLIKLGTLLLFLMGGGILNAQNLRISGTIISEEDGEPIVGATVKVENSMVGSITDIDGKFTILGAPDNARQVTVSFIGYATRTVTIQPNMLIKISAKTELLDEVMVVAYGTATRNSFTGSATQISGENIAIKSPTEISKALQGEVAGVQVINTSGQPGSNATIRIRGIGSVNSDNSPLYVVDGIPFGANISGINPTDIESTTILKDATATALYGSRAANGVVLITTKKGKKGQMNVEAELKYGINTRFIPLYESIDSPERFTELVWEGLRNQEQYYWGSSPEDAPVYANERLFNYRYGGIEAGYNMWNAEGNALIDPATGRFYPNITRKYTPEKWEDYIFRTGQKYQGDIKISGGSDKVTYFTSLGFIKDEGYYIGSDFQRFNARSNVNANVTSWLTSVLNLSYAHMTSNQPGQTDNMNNGFQFVNFMPSLYPVFERDEDGNKIPDEVVGGYLYDYGMNIGYGRPYASGINPAGAINLDENKTTSNQFNGNLMLEARFLNDFKATANLGMQYLGQNNNDLTNPYYGDAAGLGRILKKDSTYMSMTSNQILSYNKQIGKHNIDAFVAHESMFVDESYIEGQKSLLVRADNTEWSNAVIMGYMDSDTYGYSMESYFGQVRYDYDSKYHFNASVRRDGSSRFSKGNKWGTFGSVGAAWVISKENFMKNLKWIDDLKIKASWGLIGNQSLNTGYPIANYYSYDNLYSISNNNGLSAIRMYYKGNPDLTWEKTSNFNTGIEFGIAKVIEGEVEYFHKTTSDMLFMKQMAPSLGYAAYPVNDGKMQNQGVEFSLTAHALNTRDLKLDIRVNGGYYQNKMISMPMDDTTGKEKPIELQGAYAWSNGHSVYDFYLREYAGVDPNTGLALFNQYYNVKADGSKELITDMEIYKSKNNIEKLEVETTSDFTKATRKYVGKSANPILSGGFGFDFSFKGLEVSSTFTYGIGGYAIDYVYATLMGDHSAGARNWHKDIENRWQKPGDVTDVPRLTAGYDLYTNAISTRFLTSRSYLNLANARIGYTLPKEWMTKAKIKSLSVYVTGDNLFMLSARDGFVSMASVSGDSERSQYAPLSTIMGGVKIVF